MLRSTPLDITDVRDENRAEMDRIEGRQHLRDHQTGFTMIRANPSRRASGRSAQHTEGCMSNLPRILDAR
jgi:hypothetical protein